MFEHIADPFIRAAIQSPCQNVDKTALSSILDDCVMSLNEDYDNEDVPFDVFDARSIAPTTGTGSIPKWGLWLLPQVSAGFLFNMM